MKKIQFYILLSVLTVTMAPSCSLDEQPEAYASKKEIFSSEEGLHSYA